MDKSRLLTDEEILRIYKNKNWLIFEPDLQRGTTIAKFQDTKTRAETLKELKEYLDKNHPYKEDIFPTTNKQAAGFMKSKGFTDENITAISGCLMRHGYWVALRNIEHFEED